MQNTKAISVCSPFQVNVRGLFINSTAEDSTFVETI